jgi:hypothetical protein
VLKVPACLLLLHPEIHHLNKMQGVKFLLNPTTHSHNKMLPKVLSVPTG